MTKSEMALLESIISKHKAIKASGGVKNSTAIMAVLSLLIKYIRELEDDRENQESIILKMNLLNCPTANDMVI